MKRLIFAALALTLCTQVACTGKGKTKGNGKKLTHEADLNEVIKGRGSNDAEKAQSILTEVDLLMGARGFVHADILVNEALRLDPTNFKAKFYKKLLAITANAEGSVDRARDLIAKDEASKNKLDNDMAVIEKTNPVLSSFLTRKGMSAIKNEKDVQKFADSITKSINDLRVFLKENRNNEMAIKYVFQQQHCDWYFDEYGNSYSVYCDDGEKQIREIKINSADIEGLQQVVAGYQILTLLPNTYDLTGVLKVAQNSNSLSLDKQDRAYEVKEQLTSENDFGLIRNQNSLKVLNELGADSVSAIKTAIQLKDQLCKNGESSSENRPDHLFAEGFCIKDVANADIMTKAITSAIAGQSVVVNLGRKLEQVTYSDEYSSYTYSVRSGDPIKTTIHAQSFIQSPIKDLKKSIDADFNKCGHLSSIADTSLGGALVKKDANKLLTEFSTCGKGPEINLEY